MVRCKRKRRKVPRHKRVMASHREERNLAKAKNDYKTT
jgi:hypothetical protein